jgi:hypothetical protein
MNNKLYVFKIPTDFKEVVLTISKREIEEYLVSDIHIEYDGRGKIEFTRYKYVGTSRTGSVDFKRKETYTYLNKSCVVCLSLEEARSRLYDWVNERIDMIKTSFGESIPPMEKEEVCNE